MIDLRKYAGQIGCPKCLLLHDGILKGECNCENCDCWLKMINTPIIVNKPNPTEVD